MLKLYYSLKLHMIAQSGPVILLIAVILCHSGIVPAMEGSMILITHSHTLHSTNLRPERLALLSLLPLYSLDVLVGIY